VKRILLFSALFILSKITFAQFFGQLPQQTKYNAAKVVDPDYGITMYEKLNFQTGGDSVRNDKKGYASQGWIEDIYESGKLLHKGYYEDGHLKIYKNYYENGNLERAFKILDFKRCNLQLFYADGKLKSDITYYEGAAQIWTDYYQNGQIEYTEENTKSMEYLIKRNSYAQDGKPQDLFELVDPKKKVYSKKEYYENGSIKSEGAMKYNKAVADYQKDGVWKNYDEKGKITEEKYVNGELVN
jgi:antitoxin component YwqK of YwqJK toxin-antitoxin module